MTLRTRAVPVVLALVLAAGLVGTGPVSQARPARAGTEGSAGIGDPYFPRDGNGGIDVLHYDVRDSYSLETGRLKGRTGLDVRATQDLSRFNLDFLLPVQSVKVDGRRARFQQVGDHELRITPGSALAAGTEFRVSVRYAGQPARERSGGESNWLADDSEVVAMNEPHMATWWFPANDHPRDKASFDIWISVPRGNTVVANGVLVSRKRHGNRPVYHWRATEPMAPYLAFFAAGSFDTRSTSCNGIPSYVAVSRQPLAGNRGLQAKGLADLTCAVVTAYSGVLGPYPFGATGGVVTHLPVSFALENQTRPTYPGLPGATPALVAHEIAHQWFGDAVSVSGWRDIWLNEGFAQFLQTYYLTEVVSGRSMQNWLTDTYAGAADDQGFWELAIDDPGPEHLFSGAVYARGSMAVQALRHRIGETAFWTLLRTWVEQRRYGNGSVADFEALAATVSGQDLTAFFDAWLHAPRPPARTADNGLV